MPKDNKSQSGVWGRFSGLRNSNFSKPEMLIFVLVFGLIGYFIFRSFATAPVIATLEAEQMSLPTGGSIITDSTASGGKAIKLVSNGSATGSVSLSSSVTSLTVMAKAGTCQGYPSMSVSVDGSALLSGTSVSSGSWAAYSANTNLASGTHTLNISFNNAYSYAGHGKHNNGSCTRALYVDVTTFYGPTPPPPPAPTVAISASPNSVSAGQSSTLTWSSTNATACSASGAWSGSEPTAGSTSTGALNQTSTYSLTCTGSGGSATASATVTVTSSGGGGTSWIPASGTTCTIYASPTGTSGGNGSQASPYDYKTAYNHTVPGSVLCFLPGTYNVASTLYLSAAHSGTDTAWITMRSSGGTVTFNFTGSPCSCGVFQAGGNTGSWTGANHIIIDGMTFNANNAASVVLASVQGSHHMVFRNNIVENGGAGGIWFNAQDYGVAEHNLAYHVGYNQGWSSALDIWYGGNSAPNCTYGSGNTTTAAYDTAPGFHNVIADNIVSGTQDASTYKSDGNGIIVDGCGSTPASLIINNVIYENRGRAIEVFANSGNFWIVNNTAYKNGLPDGTTNNGYANYVVNGVSNVHWVNNISYATDNRYNFQQFGANSNSTTGLTYSHNLWYSGLGNQYVPSSVTGDSTQLMNGNPLFTNPPTFDDTLSGQFNTALEPWNLGNDLTLQAGSAAVNAGIDPRTVSGMTSDLQTILDRYMSTDVAGNPRFNGTIDIGAYEL